MTARRTLDKALAEPTYKRIIERGPWAHYAKCWECGAEAGNCCVGDDGKEALDVCDGRVLVIDDSASRCRVGKHERETRRDRPPRNDSQTRSRRARGVLQEPQYAPCQRCGARTRLWGAAVETGHTWCRQAACRKARRDAREARRVEARRQARAALLPAVRCHWCGVVLEPIGRRRGRPCCGAVVCRRGIEREKAAERRRRFV